MTRQWLPVFPLPIREKARPAATGAVTIRAAGTEPLDGKPRNHTLDDRVDSCYNIRAVVLNEEAARIFCGNHRAARRAHNPKVLQRVIRYCGSVGRAADS